MKLETDFVKNHGQNITEISLKKYLSSPAINNISKDFVKYYIYKFIDDPILKNIINSEQINSESLNIYSLLLQANLTNDSILYLKNLALAEELDRNNLFLLCEKYEIEKNSYLKELYLKKLQSFYSNNELILPLSIENARKNGDTLKYLELFHYLKNRYNNFYSNLNVAGEYIVQNKIDSAKLYFNKSIAQKKTIASYVYLASIYLNYDRDFKKSIEYLNLAKEIDKDDEDVMYQESWIYFEKNDTLNARKSFEKLINLYPYIDYKKDYLTYLLSVSDINNSKDYYLKNIEHTLSNEERAGYFLVFESKEAKKSKNIERYYKKLDSIESLYGLTPLNYSNKIMQIILEHQ